MKLNRFARLVLLALVALTLASQVFMPVSVSARPELPPVKEAAPVKPTATAELDDTVYPDCNMSPLNYVGEAPFTVKFYGNGGSSYSWFTMDASTENTGSGATWEHAFLNEGEYLVRLTCYSPRGTFSFVSTWITVLAPTAPTMTPVAPLVTPIPSAVAGPSIEVQHDGCDDQMSKVENNGVVVVICNNEGEINIYPPATATPIVVTEPEASDSTSLWQKMGLALVKLIRAFFGLSQ